MTEKDSLSKSHSKVSNFKLTLVCILAAISFALLFVGLCLYFSLDKQMIFLIIGIIGAVLTVLSFVSFFFFKR